MFSTPEFNALQEVYGALFEASKKQVLMNRLHFDEHSAEFFDNRFRGAAVIMANKFLDFLRSGVSDPEMSRRALIPDENGTLNLYGRVLAYTEALVAISDWIRTGLNGNLGPWKTQGTFNEMYAAAQKWHRELEAGDGELNYRETGKILRDYRDSNGLGLYWVDLQTNYSPEECERMGHCGRTEHETLYSLREYKKHQGDYTLNGSHLTAAIGEDGIIYQLKGPHNSHPTKEFHPQIVDLILTQPNINGFGSEYQAESDFSFNDLTAADIRKIYEAKPHLFSRRRERRALLNAGLIEKLDPEPAMNLEIWEEHFDQFFNFDVNDDWVLSVLKGEWFEDSGYSPPLSDLISNMDRQNTITVERIVKAANEYDEEEHDVEDDLVHCIEDLGLEDVEYAIQNAYRYGYESEIQDVVYTKVHQALQEWADSEIEMGEFRSIYGRKEIHFMVRIEKTKDIYSLFSEEDIELAHEYGADAEIVDIFEYVVGETEGNKLDIYLSSAVDYTFVDDETFNKHLKDTLAEI